MKPPALDPMVLHFVNSSCVLDIGEHSGKQVYALPSPNLCPVPFGHWKAHHLKKQLAIEVGIPILNLLPRAVRGS